MNDTLSLQYRNQRPALGITTPLWDFNELKTILDAKCNGTYYKIVDEYVAGGNNDIWLQGNLPWQEWLNSTGIKDLNQLSIWVARYRAYITAFLV